MIQLSLTYMSLSQRAKKLFSFAQNHTCKCDFCGIFDHIVFKRKISQKHIDFNVMKMRKSIQSF